ncbi:cyclic nucleotide-binding domain-containing protein [Desulfotalea psychrophila]|uniref:Cyclic nucleotide-binding domain-containing protein n=1 Tax=Desulfotalea psychrophila (strain LSv54 / DSM 12343) TaxID=177439 RepID=Q6AKJ5_DESPS|nr:cyclic nucleotide-binding domain-containing protein [Desulfotalea psychrophila]CAG37130.1 unknown protein [Desulfotalea psychrophila LSv54]
MNFDTSKQPAALLGTRDRLRLAEEEREKKRVEDGCQAFISGKYSLILREDIVQGLLVLIDGSPELLLSLLPSLSHLDKEVRFAAASLLSLGLEKWKGVFSQETVSLCLAQAGVWYEGEDDYFLGLPVLAKQMSQLAASLVESGDYGAVHSFLRVVDRIGSGELVKEQRIRSSILASKNLLLTRPLLEKMWTEYLEGGCLCEDISTIFVLLGRKAALFLLQRMVQSQEKDERLALVTLLTGFGSAVTAILLDYLSKNPPWYISRNLLSIYVEAEGENSYDVLKDYVASPDIRLQEAVVEGIVSLEGDSLVPHLLELLPLLAPSLQARVIRELVDLGGDFVYRGLFDFLEGSFSLLRKNQEALLSLVAVLEKKFSARALFLLTMLLEESRQEPISKELEQATLRALALVRPKLRHEQRRKKLEEEVLFDTDPVELQRGQASLRELEAKIERAMQRNSKIVKEDLLYQEGLAFVQKNDLLAAQLTVDRLMAINPGGFADYTSLAKEIARRRSNYFPNQQVIERVLSSCFSKEEQDVFFKLMKVEEYRPGEEVARVGEINACLYFVLDGSLQMFYLADNRKVFLKKFGPGECCGQRLFFDASLWSVNLLATGLSHLGVLAYDDFINFEKKEPYLGAKLRAYCAQGNTISSLVQMSGGERRSSQRFPIKTSAHLVLTGDREDSQAVKGQTRDVSQQGVSLFVRSGFVNSVHSLLGENVAVRLGPDSNACFCSGQIVAIRIIDITTHCLHIKFKETLDMGLLASWV